MNFIPGLHELHLARRQAPFEHLPVRDTEDNPLFVVAHVNMWRVVLRDIKRVHGHENAVKHADGRHTPLLRRAHKRRGGSFNDPRWCHHATGKTREETPLTEALAWPRLSHGKAKGNPPSLPRHIEAVHKDA